MIALPFILAVSVLALVLLSQALADQSSFPGEFGVEGPAPREGMHPDELPAFLDAVRDLGAGFIVVQVTPERNTDLARARGSFIGIEGTEQGLRDFAAACRKRGLSFYADLEATSYCSEGEYTDKNGRDILAHSDGTHRWDIAGSLLESLRKLPEFRGVVYDEAEWNTLRRDRNTNGGNDGSSTGRIHPFFAVVEHLGVFDARRAVLRSAASLADSYRKAGVRMMGEHVFPVMFHTFARAGMDVCTKFMKEGRDSVYAAAAIGAALQYHADFAVSPDMWGKPGSPHFGPSPSGFPGHPPEELRCSLLYAWWMGASRIFVENVYADFLGVGHYTCPPAGLLDRIPTEGEGVARYVPSEYGKVYRWFVRDYVPAHPRPYSFREMRPDVAIVRFDDSYWGQPGRYFQKFLFGGADLPGADSIAWIGLWHLLTHGYTSPEGISYHNAGWTRPHGFFTPLNNVVVYDDEVSLDRLRGLKVVFLTGLRVSPETRDAIAQLVRDDGLICVAQKSLAPADLAAKVVPDAASTVIAHGKGKWLLTDNFDTDSVRGLVAPWLGAPDEIRYRFGSHGLCVKQLGDDNSIQISLDGARVW